MSDIRDPLSAHRDLTFPGSWATILFLVLLGPGTRRRSLDEDACSAEQHTPGFRARPFAVEKPHFQRPRVPAR